MGIQTTPIITIKTTGSTDSITTKDSTDSNTSGSTDSNTTGSTDSNTTPDNSSSSSTVVSTNTSSTSDTKTYYQTAKNLANWIIGLGTTDGDYKKENNLPNTTDLEKDPLVTELIAYFNEPITNPTTSSHSPQEYFDVLTGQGHGIDGISSPSDINVTYLATQLKNDLTPTLSSLEKYFGEQDLAGVIVDSLRVLGNLNTVSGITDSKVKANFETGKYWNRQGVVEWYTHESGDEKAVLKRTDVGEIWGEMMRDPLAFGGAGGLVLSQSFSVVGNAAPPPLWMNAAHSFALSVADLALFSAANAALLQNAAKNAAKNATDKTRVKDVRKDHGEWVSDYDREGVEYPITPNWFAHQIPGLVRERYATWTIPISDTTIPISSTTTNNTLSWTT
jgi:hypothetical protein